MEITEEFKIENRQEVQSFLNSRGFRLFEELSRKLKPNESFLEEKFPEANTKQVESLVIHPDYKQYEINTHVRQPSQVQLRQINKEHDLLCFPGLQKLDKFLTLEYGFKVGLNPSNKENRWVEKYALFVIDGSKSNKYFCKIWYETEGVVKGENKLQYLESYNLVSEVTELFEIQYESLRVNEIMSFVTYFLHGNQTYQEGIKHLHDGNSQDSFIIELWKTDFIKNTFEKQRKFRVQGSMVKRGEKEGKNELGQPWGESWWVSADNIKEGWTKWWEDDNGQVRQKWGESQDTTHGVEMTRKKFYEKWQREGDYWESNFENETHFKRVRNNVVSSGSKVYNNNRNYSCEEEWTLFESGHLKVVRTIDDGLGQRQVREYNQERRGDQVVNVYEKAEIDDIRNNQKIEIKKGRNVQNEEWELQRLINFMDNYEKVDNKGKNQEGEWREEWLEKDSEKWARKEGQNYNNRDQWREEWYEKRRDNREIEESKCEKWGLNMDRNEEWTEKWGETYKGDKKEKWADKWYIDRNQGLKRGENWGQEYNSDGSIKHHWCEQWDSQGRFEKRDEYH